MKKIGLQLLFTVLVINAFSQKKIELKKYTGFDPLVIELDSSYSSVILYNLTKEWIQKTYENPFAVLKGDIANKYIKINGSAVNGCCYKSMNYPNCFTVVYTLELDFKDGRYRFTYTIDKLLTSDNKEIYTFNEFFKDDSTPKKIYNTAIPTLTETVNNLSLSLFQYINKSKDKKDW
jgi:hypothetical protein